VLREELLALVADRLSVSSELLVSLLSQGGRLASGGGSSSSSDASRTATRLSPEEQVEREFLAYCVAFPDLGGPVLAELDIERELNVPSMQSAAAWLRDHLSALDGTIDDPDLASLLTALKVRAQAPEITRGGFEVQRLQLALRRVRRDISAAPAGAKTALAKRREELQKAFDDAQLTLLEQDRGGAE
jgi:hypothetical protein